MKGKWQSCLDSDSDSDNSSCYPKAQRLKSPQDQRVEELHGSPYSLCSMAGCCQPNGSGMSDFNYLHTNCFEITVELGCVKFPPEEALYGLWQHNKEPLLNFLEMVHRGIKGVVMDKYGKPVKNARVLVKGIRHDVTTAPGGDYWRLLPPGSHIVIAQAPGYSKVMKRVTIPLRMKRAGRVDFILQPLVMGPKKFLPGHQKAVAGSQDPLREPTEPDLEPLRTRRQPAADGSKPWWWSYFTSLSPYKPRWLLKY